MASMLADAQRSGYVRQQMKTYRNRSNAQACGAQAASQANTACSSQVQYECRASASAGCSRRQHRRGAHGGRGFIPWRRRGGAWLSAGHFLSSRAPTFRGARARGCTGSGWPRASMRCRICCRAWQSRLTWAPEIRADPLRRSLCHRSGCTGHHSDGRRREKGGRHFPQGPKRR